MSPWVNRWIPALVAGVFAFSPLAGRAQPVTIDFDDQVEPCAFIQTTALRDRYADRGVRFRGPGPLDGPAILDTCGNFNIQPHSGNNFLAFHRTAPLMGGGVATDPSIMLFDPPAFEVSIWVAGGLSEGLFGLEAYDADNNLIASDEVAAETWAQLSVEGAGIARAVLQERGRADPPIFVADDLVYSLGEACPENAKVKARCSRANCGPRIVAKLKKGPPDSAVTFRLDGDVERRAGTNSKGKAKVKFCPVSEGDHTVEVVECGASAKTSC